MTLPTLPILRSVSADDTENLRREIEALWAYLSNVKDEIDTHARQIKELTP